MTDTVFRIVPTDLQHRPGLGVSRSTSGLSSEGTTQGTGEVDTRFPQVKLMAESFHCCRRRVPPVKFLLSVTLFLAVGPTRRVESVLPTATLRLSDGSSTYAAPAYFGSQLPEESDASFLPLRVPTGSQDGCSTVEVDDVPEEGGYTLLVERGNCFFDEKALNAQEAGAVAVIVRNSLEGIYQVSRLGHGLGFASPVSA